MIYATVRPAAGLCLLTLVSSSYASCISFLIRGSGKGILTSLKFRLLCPHTLAAIFTVRMGNGRHCFYKRFLFVVLLCELYIEFLDDSAEGPGSFSFSDSAPDRAVFFLAPFWFVLLI